MRFICEITVKDESVFRDATHGHARVEFDRDVDVTNATAIADTTREVVMTAHDLCDESIEQRAQAARIIARDDS